MTTTTSKAQNAAEVFWIIATHDDPRVAGSWTPVYQAAEAALIKAIRDEYSVTLGFARKVRSLLAEYGTDDTLTGTGNLRGIASYVAYVKANPRVVC
jgi:hypothetical protein